MRTEKYWLIHCLEFMLPDNVHTTKESAVAEAERLARLNPNKTFFVLESVAACSKTEVAWATLPIEWRVAPF